MKKPYSISLLKTAVLFLLVWMAVDSTYAQIGGRAGAYTRFGSSPRAIAAGNSWVSYAKQGAFIGYNPAFAAFDSDNSQLSASSALLNFDRQLHILQGTTPLPPDAGLGFLLRTSRITDFDGRTLSGYPTGSFSSSELQFMGAFGLSITDELALGAGFKFNYANMHPDLTASTSIGIDVGGHFQPSDNWSLGFVVQDILSSYQFNTLELYGGQRDQTQKDAFPTRIIVGGSVTFLDSLDITSSLEYQVQTGHLVQYDITTNTTGSQLQRTTTKETEGLWQGRLGVSYPAHKLLTLRTGWQWLNLSTPLHSDARTISAGFSIHPPLDNLDASIDYAILREPSNIGFAHVFAIHFYL